MEHRTTRPQFIYGTAWKEENTEKCVLQALAAGFRSIDTANQRKHYYEDGVGSALVKSYASLGITRQDLFLQTKFTYSRGQDHRKPYDENSSFSQQVRSSFASSLEHLRTEYLDSFVLHGPYDHHGVGLEDRETWKTMEDLFLENKTRALGLSNVSIEQLQSFYEFSSVKPSFVQNRCYAQTHWDQEIRSFCQTHDIRYQGFSLLTANSKVFVSPKASSFLKNLIAATRKQLPQLVFRFSQQVGMIPLTGSSSTEHLKLDRAIDDFELSPSQIEEFENIAF